MFCSRKSFSRNLIWQFSIEEIIFSEGLISSLIIFPLLYSYTSTFLLIRVFHINDHILKRRKNKMNIILRSLWNHVQCFLFHLLKSYYPGNYKVLSLCLFLHAFFLCNHQIERSRYSLQPLIVSWKHSVNLKDPEWWRESGISERFYMTWE